MHGADPAGAAPGAPMLLPNPSAASAVADLVAQHQHAAALAAHAHAAALHAHAAQAQQQQQHAAHVHGDPSMSAPHGLGGASGSGGGSNSGRTPRKHFTFEEKKQFVAAYLGTTDTLRKFCEAHGLSLTTFHSWVKAFGGTTEASYPPLMGVDHEAASISTATSAGGLAGMLLTSPPGSGGPGLPRGTPQLLLEETSGSAAKRARSNRYEKIERAVVEFINSKSAEERAMITYDVLKTVASEVADRVLDDERRTSFKVSNGWIHGVLSRNHLVLENAMAAAGSSLGVGGSGSGAVQQQQQQRVKRDLSGALKQVSGMDATSELQMLGVSAASGSMLSLQCDEEALAVVDRLADYLRTRKVDDALVLELDAFRVAFIAHTIASQSKLV